MTPIRNAARENGVEGLRGFAALCVLYTHLLTQDGIDSYSISPTTWGIFECSQGAVLLFFILSGYVIGLTCQREFTATNWWDYIRRRVVRIVPLCWISLLLAMLVRPVDWAVFLANALFLQNTIPYGQCVIPVMESNSNVWTLNYEALYYLLFFICWIRPTAWPLWTLLAAILSGVGWLLPGNWGPLTACYALGWIFWLLGYGLSRAVIPRGPTFALPWPSVLCFWIAVWQQKPLWNLCHRFDLLPRDSGAWANYAFLDFIPACIVLVLAASGRRPPLTRALCWIVALIPSFYNLWLIARGRLTLTNIDHCTVFCVVGWALWRWRPDGIRHWSRLAFVGSISYGIYILQRPIQWAVRDACWLPSGSAFSFSLRLGLAVAITVVVAWWVERHLQPWIRRRLNPVQPTNG